MVAVFQHTYILVISRCCFAEDSKEKMYQDSKCTCIAIALPIKICLATLSSPSWFAKAPSTLIRFQTNTELLCSGYGCRPYYNVENDHLKRSHQTLPKVERFENDAFWKRCFLVWTKKTMLSENGEVMKIDTTGRQATRPWVSKLADRRYHAASISR